ncbi:uncharacterized protein LOC112344923 isoform X2 [Selaginella moellendorffii]|uniref:uncharacterized protein LOC112344923 isoform X2 n=1 Tax=Selaginella moellendorffii TaxID=88036 RepID=UPI000D1CF590|nr:uncharacterized protein LOC112344923 isoform X2 [Selaginella moellendorffii]|eukprot:XP_024526291.1 uncharacterized protein LOC112344923 isoform X2 [Selaginella moellendorffii]
MLQFSCSCLYSRTFGTTSSPNETRNSELSTTSVASYMIVAREMVLVLSIYRPLLLGISLGFTTKLLACAVVLDLPQPGTLQSRIVLSDKAGTRTEAVCIYRQTDYERSDYMCTGEGGSLRATQCSAINGGMENPSRMGGGKWTWSHELQLSDGSRRNYKSWIPGVLSDTTA